MEILQGVFRVEDIDGEGGCTNGFTVVVADDPMPIFSTTPSDQTVIVGDAFSVTLPSATSGNAPLTYSISGNPSWLTLSGRVASGTPDAVGTHSITYIVDDADGDTATTSFELTVIPAVTVSITTASATIENGGTIQLNADTNGTSLTHAWSANPDEGSFSSDSAEDPIWTGPTPLTTTSYTLTLRSEDNQSRFASDSVTITVRGSSSDAPTVSLPSRSSNLVFGYSWIRVAPTVTNPAGNSLSHQWTQTGGVTIFNAGVANTYFQMPGPTSAIKDVSIKLTVTDTATLETGDATLHLRVVTQIVPTGSLFNRSNSDLSQTSGLMWGEFSQPIVSANSNVNLIRSDLFEARGTQAIGDDYVQTTPAYVTYLSMNTNGEMRLFLATVNDISVSTDLGIAAGPQLTNAAEQNFGLAIITPEKTIRRWTGSDLVASDSTEPYTFNATSVTNAGPANNQALRDDLAQYWSVGIVLADITDSSIVWSTVTTTSPVVLPEQESVPIARSAGVQVTDRPWPLSVAIRNKDGKSPSMHDMTSHISSYSWSAYGGPQAATIQVSGSARALQSALGWNDHSILISDPAGPVWWGYIEKNHSVRRCMDRGFVYRESVQCHSIPRTTVLNYAALRMDRRPRQHFTLWAS